MKEVKAFIKPNKLEKVVEQLTTNGFESVTLSESEGTGNYKRHDSSLSLNFHFTDSKVIKLELICQDDDVDKIIKIISEHAATPYAGDGIIYVSNVVEAYRIKNGEKFE